MSEIERNPMNFQSIGFIILTVISPFTNKFNNKVFRIKKCHGVANI